MNAVVWADGVHAMLANGQPEMNLPPVRLSTRSQDDAMVGYFFQRPQTDPDFQNYSKQSRWALGDDSVLEVRGGDAATELESGFQALALETGHTLEFASTKKLWGLEESKPDDPKGLFLADQWRDAAWSTGHGGHPSDPFPEHAVSQPIMVQRRSGSYPGSEVVAMLSPRSSETGGLGMKMAEYVLGSSPTAKDMDSRISRLHVGMHNLVPKLYPNNLQMRKNTSDGNEKGKKGVKGYESKNKDSDSGGGMIQANGIIQNGLDDDKVFNRQPSPNEDDVNKNAVLGEVKMQKGPGVSDMVGVTGVAPVVQGGGHHPGLQQAHLAGLDTGFDPVGIDTLQFDYSSQLLPPMDSPSILDYSSQIYQHPGHPHAQAQHPGHHPGQHPAAHPGHPQQQQQQQRSLSIMQQQQQYAHPQMGQQPTGQGMGGMGPTPGPPPPPAGPYTSSPYVMNQDPYAPMGTIMAGPAVMPQYYGMPPWGVFPTPTPAGMMHSGGGGQPQNPAAVQQQLMRGGGARPMTPQGPQDPSMTPQGAGNSVQSMQAPPGGQYQMLPPPYYDQNSSLMMGSRGMGAPMRLVPPVLVNPAAAGPPGNNPGNLNSGGLRLMGSQAQQAGPGSVLSSNASNPVGSALYTTAAANSTLGYSTSGMSFNNSNSSHMGFPPGTSMGMGMGHQPTQGNLGYGNSALGPIGSSTIGSLASGLGGNAGSPRRDSFDRRDSNSLGGSNNSNAFSGGLENQFGRQMAAAAAAGKGGQFYGPLGTLSASPGPIGMMPPSQSLTPPPSLNGSSGNLNLGALGSRMMSAAPGAEAKFLVRNGPLGGGAGAAAAAAAGVFGSSSSLFPARSLQRNPSLEKPTGRSRLLEDFRNNRYPSLQLRDLANHIVEFSQDQHGSRFIQQKLERATPAEKQIVFSEILGAAYSLMTDVFGNYVIQKFFEFGTQEQKQALAQKVKGHVLPLALQMYGCRVIQKALESIPPEQQKEVVKELDGHVLKCVKDQNGNHVVQKCIECVDPMALQFIINAFQGQVYALSTHPYGCRVIQRILEHCTGEQTSPVLEELHQHTEQLVQDQYGNYVVQHVLEHGRAEDKSKIVSIVRGKVLQLSQHKFASNVVEKCVTHSSRAERTVLIEEVCTCHDGALYTMMKDQYANYVVQKMIEVAEPNQRKLLLHKIRPHIASLRKYTYGKHILAKLEKYLVKNSPGNDLGPIGAPPNGSL